MLTTRYLLDLADALMPVLGLTERQISWKMFGDTNKLGHLRAGADITLTRYRAALSWIARAAPEGAAGDRVRELLAPALVHLDAQPAPVSGEDAA